MDGFETRQNLWLARFQVQGASFELASRESRVSRERQVEEDVRTCTLALRDLAPGTTFLVSPLRMVTRKRRLPRPSTVAAVSALVLCATNAPPACGGFQPAILPTTGRTGQGRTIPPPAPIDDGLQCSRTVVFPCRSAAARSRRRSRREGSGSTTSLRLSSSAAVSQSEAGTSTDAEAKGDKRTADEAMASMTTMPVSRAIELLSSHRQNRQLETEIVRLGRKGRTDDALDLYRAVWTVELLGSRLDDSRSNKKRAGWPTLTAEEARFVRECKIRPTTRLMNSAIDACARSRPARQNTAFAIFDHATSKYADGGPPGESSEKDGDGNTRRREK